MHLKIILKNILIVVIFHFYFSKKYLQLIFRPVVKILSSDADILLK